MIGQILFFLLFFFSLFCETISSFYGPIDVEEPVLLELIHSPAMQRLKHIHQYGVAYYTTHQEEYNRYDHSIGVFAILRKNGASLREQISGLLHDVSHTVFSHVGDWVFGKEHQEDDYQSLIYKLYLAHSGIEEILIKHRFTINQVLPKDKEFGLLEQPLPNLCADRIDYNIQGAYFQNFLSKKEALELYDNLQFVEGRWVSTKVHLLKKLARYSLFMTQNCWGSGLNHAHSRWLASAILKGLDLGLLSWHEIHFGVDQDVWEKLLDSQDPFIQQQMNKLAHPHDFFSIVDPAVANEIVKFRCRGIDPWVLQEGEIVRLSSMDSDLAREIAEVKEKALIGWPIYLK